MGRSKDEDKSHQAKPVGQGSNLFGKGADKRLPNPPVSKAELDKKLKDFRDDIDNIPFMPNEMG